MMKMMLGLASDDAVDTAPDGRAEARHGRTFITVVADTACFRNRLLLTICFASHMDVVPLQEFL